MKFSAVASALALFAFAQAAPIEPVESTDNASINHQSDVVFMLATKSVNDCGNSTFENNTSGGSPKVADCQKIAYNIRNGGSWTYPLSGLRKLVSYGTCAFGIEGSFDLGLINRKIGNQDIIDLINDSIEKFASGGRVGSEGKMLCQYDPNQRTIPSVWGLYHK